MKRVMELSEVLGTVETPAAKCEVCAAAEAGFDEAAGRLVVTLRAFLRPAELRVKEQRWGAEWLPPAETVTEAADAAEGRDLAREIFHRWVRKVRAAVPQLHPA